MKKKSGQNLMKLLTLLIPVMLMAGCMTSPPETPVIDAGGNNAGGDNDNVGGDGQQPAGLNCSATGAFDACAEARRIGALTQSFNHLVSTVYGARYSNASRVADGAGRPCPGGGTYSVSISAASALRMTFASCTAPVGVLSGTITVARQTVNQVTPDNDQIMLDLAIDGIRYAGALKTQHYGLGLKMMNVGLVSPLTLTPQEGSVLTVNSFGVSLTEQADGSYRESGDLSFSIANSTGSVMQIQSAQPASYFKTEVDSSGIFLTFDAPDDGALRYVRSVPGQVQISGDVVAEGDRLSSQLTASGAQLSVSGTWNAAAEAALYAVN